MCARVSVCVCKCMCNVCYRRCLCVCVGAKRAKAAIYENKLRGFGRTWCSLAYCDSSFPHQITAVKPKTNLRFTTEHTPSPTADVIKQQANIHSFICSTNSSCQLSRLTLHHLLKYISMP